MRSARPSINSRNANENVRVPAEAILSYAEKHQINRIVMVPATQTIVLVRSGPSHAYQ